MPVEIAHTFICGRCDETKIFRSTKYGSGVLAGEDDSREWISTYEMFRRHGLQYRVEVTFCPACVAAFVEWGKLTPKVVDAEGDW